MYIYIYIYIYSIIIYLLYTIIRHLVCFRFFEPFYSYLKIINDWSTTYRIKIIFFLYIKSIIIRANVQFISTISSSSLWCSSGICLSPFLFLIYILPIHDIIGQFQDIHYHTYADDIHSVPSCLTPQMYEITPNYVNVHVLSDHGFYIIPYI